MLYPLRFIPLYYEKVWGGRRLDTVLGRELPPDESIGESWEVADHPHGESVVANGPEAGVTLHDLIERYGAELLGARVAAEHATRFPLLVKFIDATDNFPCRCIRITHYAAAHANDLGKTEMWYVLHADPGAD